MSELEAKLEAWVSLSGLRLCEAQLAGAECERRREASARSAVPRPLAPRSLRAKASEVRELLERACRVLGAGGERPSGPARCEVRPWRASRARWRRAPWPRPLGSQVELAACGGRARTAIEAAERLVAEKGCDESPVAGKCARQLQAKLEDLERKAVGPQEAAKARTFWHPWPRVVGAARHPLACGATAILGAATDEREPPPGASEGGLRPSTFHQ